MKINITHDFSPLDFVVHILTSQGRFVTGTKGTGSSLVFQKRVQTLPTSAFMPSLYTSTREYTRTKRRKSLLDCVESNLQGGRVQEITMEEEEF